ncbi:MAG: LacI family DNA-binding transcriptional regulator [Tepidisphaeraceae bacterium]
MLVTDIAKKAGVSIATVSRVLNEHPSVRPETVQQVRRAMEGMPYDRFAIRRGPRPGKRFRAKATSIGIVVLGITHERYFKLPVFAAVVSSITRAAAAREINVVIDEVLEADRLSDRLTDGVLDGALVFAASFANPLLMGAVRRRMPIVHVMGEELAATGVDQVLPDNLAIGHLAFKHLAERGCERLGYVSTQREHEAMRLREMAFAAVACRAGLAAPVSFVTAGGVTPPLQQGVSLEKIADAIAALPAQERPTGLFVSQDVETIGLYPLLVQRGIRPGRDVTIVSCNNEESLAMLNPRPASIDLGTDDLGRRALTRLLNRIAHPNEPSLRMLVAPSIAADVAPNIAEH